MSYVRLFRLSIFSAGIAYAGKLMAEDMLPTAKQERFNWMQHYQVSGTQGQSVFRQEVMERMRKLNQVEQKLMHDTGVNGRERLTGGNSTQDAYHEKPQQGFGTGHSYGSGFESRQLHQGISSPAGSTVGGRSGIGQSMGVNSRQGRAR